MLGPLKKLNYFQLISIYCHAYTYVLFLQKLNNSQT